MNDKDIIKVLRCCEDGFCYAGNGCPLGHIGDGDACITELCKNALDLINRQKAEIARLNHIRAELSKEIDRLKTEMSYMKSPNTIGDTHEMGAW